MIHRVERPKVTRAANDAEVEGYGDRLVGLFNRWRKENLGQIGDLVERLQGAAEDEFPKAYIRGKRAALPGSRLERPDQAAIAKLTASNLHYLQFSLETAMQTRALMAKLHGEAVGAALDQSFLSRIRVQYGGRLWQVMEAGRREAVGELRQRLSDRFDRLGIVQEDGDGEDPEDASDESDQMTDADLAAAMGITLAVFMTLLKDRSGGGHVRVGTEYLTEEDDHVCGGCENSAGEYWAPEEPPLPGENCFGFQGCRCWLQTVWED